MSTRYSNLKPALSRLARVAMGTLFILSLFTYAGQGALAQSGQGPETSVLSWNYYTVDAQPWFYEMTTRSARFNSAGVPSVAYGGDHLYYAYFDSASAKWVQKLVDGANQVGSFASLALDKFGNPRISYYDAQNRSLKFAYPIAGDLNNWSTQIVDVPSVVSDPAALPAEKSPDDITFEDVAAQHLRYPGYDVPGFQEKSEQIQSGEATNVSYGVGQYTSIAVDSNNIVHISYYDSDNRSLKYARWDGFTWTKLVVDGNPSDLGYDVGKYSSIAVDSNGLARIAYMDEKYDGLKYALDSGTPGVWWGTGALDAIDSFANGARVGAFASLALDSNGNAYISYLDWTNFRLKYATNRSGSWAKSVVDSSGDVGWYSSIALNNSNAPMISYHDAANGALRLARQSGNNWNITTLVQGGLAGYYSSIAPDPNGNPGIAFYSEGNGQYRFTRWNGSQWIGSLIGTAGNVGISTSLALRGNNVWISYFNDVGDQLKLAYSLGFNFQKQVLYSSSPAGNYSSIKISSSGEPRVAFYNIYYGDLMFAYQSAGVWYFQIVDSTNDVGQYPSLALDDYGRPNISYYDVTNQTLKYAYWNGSAWILQTVDNSANVGRYTSLVLSRNPGQCLAIDPGMSNCPMISYYDVTNADLKFAQKSSLNAWVSHAVDSAGSVGQYSAMVLDFNNSYHIVYYDATNLDLKHATSPLFPTTGGNWFKEFVDPNTGDVGQYASLAVSPGNILHASYYDVTNGDLKHAWGSTGAWSLETVDSSGNVGQFTSIAVNLNGDPGISYYDATNGDLKFASVFSPFGGLRNFLPLIRR